MIRIVRHITILLLCALLPCSCVRTPNKMIKAAFSIDIKDINYTLVEKVERWTINGDGNCFLRLSLKETSKEELDLLKNRMISLGASQLPIEENLMVVNYANNMANQTFKRGWYLLLTPNWDDSRLLIFDEENKELITCYIIM